MLGTGGITADMLLQVHDELIFEVPSSQAEAAREMIINIMQQAGNPVIDLSVPLVAEAGIAESWAEAH